MEHDAYLKRMNSFEENECKAHSDLWEHFAKALKGKLEVWSDFESATHSSPTNLLKSIKEHYLSYEEDRCEIVTLVGSFKDYF